ncbi:unnamed protein product [Echinostoma caproni]|uniref:Ovule protein n=1 Tax=Echinostoma caproni TaxID=27848 RepID=A0A183APT0_9TREM|nr:unnamed protein product [Echinostoma caproni]
MIRPYGAPDLALPLKLTTGIRTSPAKERLHLHASFNLIYLIQWKVQSSLVLIVKQQQQQLILHRQDHHDITVL